MRRHALLAALLALPCACVTYHETTRTLPAPPPAAPVASPSAPAAEPAMSKDEAIRRAFQYCEDRSLRVNRVTHAKLDGQGRWEIELRGEGETDRAKMLIDGQDGRLLKGRFRETGDSLND